jgi:hypothetical protein
MASRLRDSSGLRYTKVQRIISNSKYSTLHSILGCGVKPEKEIDEVRIDKFKDEIYSDGIYAYQENGESAANPQKARDPFIVDNSISGWTGLQYLEKWVDIAIFLISPLDISILERSSLLMENCNPLREFGF